MSNGKAKRTATRFRVAEFITNYVEELDTAYHLTDSSSLTEDSDAQKALGLSSTGLIVAAARRSFFRQEALAKIFRLLPRESKVLLVYNGSANHRSRTGDSHSMLQVQHRTAFGCLWPFILANTDIQPACH